ncbi:MAG TPA: SRPBCC family protein [Actinomycetota bacterium]|nr:SRPBCC family protein [Actinomycetota bacterium]
MSPRRDSQMIAATTHTTSDPQRVIDVLRTPDSWPRWQPEIIATQGPAQVDVGDVVRGRARMLGFGVDGHSTTTGVSHEMVREDVIVGVRMEVTYTVDPADGGGSTITHNLELHPLEGPAGTLLRILLLWRLKRMQRAALALLVREVEGIDPVGSR